MSKKIIKKNEIFTIPNILSMFRILLIPVIVWLYFVDENHYGMLGVIALSGLTDIVDGKIARKFNMISDFGKILDPIADKFTQGIIFICLTSEYTLLYWLVGLFAIKELVSALVGYTSVKKADEVHGAMWHGKLNTVLIYSLICSLLLFPNMNNTLANVLIICCAVFMLISFTLYLRFFIKNIKKANITKNQFFLKFNLRS